MTRQVEPSRASRRWDRRRQRRRQLLVALAVAVLLTLVVTLFFVLRDAPAPRTAAARGAAAASRQTLLELGGYAVGAARPAHT